jgi:hypothetical protein
MNIATGPNGQAKVTENRANLAHGGVTKMAMTNAEKQKAYRQRQAALKPRAPKPCCFVTDMHNKTGKSKRTIQRTTQASKYLTLEEFQLIIKTSLDSGVQLDALIRIQPAERTDLIRRAAAGEKVSAVTPESAKLAHIVTLARRVAALNGSDFLMFRDLLAESVSP